MTFPHPETGELLDSREDFQRALADIEEQMAPFYRVRRQIRMAAAEKFDLPVQPLPRYRTVTQEKVARCPRCGGKEDVERIREIILRGWDEQLYSFEMMSEADEQWLRRWAGDPLAKSEEAAE